MSRVEEIAAKLEQLAQRLKDAGDTASLAQALNSLSAYEVHKKQGAYFEALAAREAALVRLIDSITDSGVVLGAIAGAHRS